MPASETPQIQVRDKWDDYVVTGDSLAAAALKLLRQRVEQGFWYDGDAAERAATIVHDEDGEAAWAFLDARSNYEYEHVQVAHTL